ncbi:MAG: CvpA family protein [Clostridia bacterium]|nr:CvpA family protein [Clostridia bacterium]
MTAKKFTTTILKLLLSFVVLFLIFWFEMPALNLRSGDLWSFVIQGIIIFTVINAFSYVLSFLKRFRTDKNNHVYIENNGEKFKFKTLGKPILIAIVAIVLIIALTFVMNIIGAQIFNAKRYNQLLTLQDGDFKTDVAEIEMRQIPVVDKDSAQTLGKRKLGEMSDFVSQFEIAGNYTQINYKDEPYRVTPLVYGDVIKWFNNQSGGIPAYIKVNMTTQETSTVRVNGGIKYSESEYFMRNIHRYLRFKYPTKIFDDVSFEIDENGIPFWVASTVEFRIGFWSGRDIGGAVLVNAVTGEAKYYDLEEVPTWVDQVFSSGMIIEQLDFNGLYRGGFWNSIFGQKGVLQSTEGYNYLAINDDVWLYTGMTSVVSDESNVGFVLVNLRTKEAKYYEVPGAKEYSAMSSAEGAVQEKGYVATFPILLNVSDRPTYFMSLKDDAGLVKMYAFVDVEAYQVLGTGASVNTARENYIANLKHEEIEVEDTQEKKEYNISGKIVKITSAVVNGNTKYYVLATNVVDEGTKNPDVACDLATGYSTFVFDVSLSQQLPFAQKGDEFTATYVLEEDNKTKYTDLFVHIKVDE